MALQKGIGELTPSLSVDLSDLTAHPECYDFFPFRPGLNKLILYGAADTAHISILWYATASRVGLHYHAMTEAVYVITGQQRDEQGGYPTGSLYFNPPGSGHAISESWGFFLLVYAAPPDFANTGHIQPYSPIQFNAASLGDEVAYPFEAVRAGVKIYRVPLQPGGGLEAQLIKSASPDHYHYTGHCLLVLKGNCQINGTSFEAGMLVVAASSEARPYAIRAADDGMCLLLGLAFDTYSD